MVSHPERHSLLAPAGAAPFVVPGSRFRECYYWDTFWSLRGLLACGLLELAQARRRRRAGCWRGPATLAGAPASTRRPAAVQPRAAPRAHVVPAPRRPLLPPPPAEHPGHAAGGGRGLGLRPQWPALLLFKPIPAAAAQPGEAAAVARTAAAARRQRGGSGRGWPRQQLLCTLLPHPAPRPPLHADGACCARGSARPCAAAPRAGGAAARACLLGSAAKGGGGAGARRRRAPPGSLLGGLGRPPPRVAARGRGDRGGGGAVGPRGGGAVAGAGQRSRERLGLFKPLAGRRPQPGHLPHHASRASRPE